MSIQTETDNTDRHSVDREMSIQTETDNTDRHRCRQGNEHSD